jgi:hypothetical protein
VHKCHACIVIYTVVLMAWHYRTSVLLWCRMNTETSLFGWIFWLLLQ